MDSSDQICHFSLSWLKPILVMIVVQIITVANNIFYKLAMIDSMPSSILIAYRFIFGTLSLAPFALYDSRTKPTWKQAKLTFVYGLLGGSLYHNLCLASLTSASATFVTGILNVTPIITLVLGLIVKRNSKSLETLAYGTCAGKIKLAGIMLSISGVMVLAFFKRVEININVSASLLPQHYQRTRDHNDQVLGLVLAIIAAFSNACFITIQAKFKEDTQNIYFIPFTMNLMGAIQGVVYAICVERDWEQWKLGWNLRFWASSFVGVLGSGLTTTLTTWCILEMGPLFVSAFNPIGFILMALVGSLVLQETLYVTSVAAIVLIIAATLLVLYGKLKEMDNTSEGSGSDQENEEKQQQQQQQVHAVLEN